MTSTVERLEADDVRELVVAHANQQARMMEQATGLLARLSEHGREQVERCEEVSGLLDHLDTEAHRGSASLDDLATELRDLIALNARLTESLGSLERIHDRIDAISEIITDIRMLGLNAAIEAARAGEKGQGFQVVATSMRELARSGARVAHEIDTLVKTGLVELTETTAQTRTRIDARAGQVQEVQERFGHVMERVAQVRETSDLMGHSAQDQARDTESMRTRIQQAMEDHSGETARMIGAITGVAVQDLDVHQARERLGEFVVLDVRSTREWTDELGHLDCAVHVPIAEPDFEGRLSRHDRTRPTLFICRSGGRSARAARVAIELGFRSVYNMAGGMLAWRAADLPSVERRAA